MRTQREKKIFSQAHLIFPTFFFSKKRRESLWASLERRNALLREREREESQFSFDSQKGKPVSVYRKNIFLEDKDIFACLWEKTRIVIFFGQTGLELGASSVWREIRRSAKSSRL